METIKYKDKDGNELVGVGLNTLLLHINVIEAQVINDAAATIANLKATIMEDAGLVKFDKDNVVGGLPDVNQETSKKDK